MNPMLMFQLPNYSVWKWNKSFSGLNLFSSILNKFSTFLREDLRLKSQNSFYPPNLYKGMVWTEGGNNKLFYLGAQVCMICCLASYWLCPLAQNQAYTFTMFDICGLWAAKLIMGEISLPAKEDMERWRIVLETWFVNFLCSDPGNIGKGRKTQ